MKLYSEPSGDSTDTTGSASAQPIPAWLTAKLILRHYLPIGERTFWKWVSAGKFPPPDIKRGGKVRLWKRENVARHIESWAQQQGGRHE